MDAKVLDAERTEAFAGRMLGVVNGAMVGLMLSVGHRTGLFDAMAVMEPATAAGVARQAGLHERYVREWLDAMTVARVVEYDPGPRTYWLPPEHAASLTRASGPNNLASFAQFDALLGVVEDDIVECFRSGGGVPYSRFPKFQTLMAEMSAEVHNVGLIDGILPLVDGLSERLHAGIDACDIGCGQGHAVNLMAQAFPDSRFTGWDFSTEAIAAAQAEATRLGLTNARFEVKDAATIDGSRKFEFVTVFDAVHDQADPATVLRNILAALADDGVFLCVDIAGSSHVDENMEHPLAPALYTISTFHCMTVSLAQDGAGLGAMWGEQTARAMLAAAGFSRVETKSIPEDIFNVYYVARR